MKSNSHCFKVGDLLRWAADREPIIPELDKTKLYTVSKVHPQGYLDFQGIEGKGWFPENFELCKNQVVINILNDL